MSKDNPSAVETFESLTSVGQLCLFLKTCTQDDIAEILWYAFHLKNLVAIQKSSISALHSRLSRMQKGIDEFIQTAHDIAKRSSEISESMNQDER